MLGTLEAALDELVEADPATLADGDAIEALHASWPAWRRSPPGRFHNRARARAQRPPPSPTAPPPPPEQPFPPESAQPP